MIWNSCKSNQIKSYSWRIKLYISLQILLHINSYSWRPIIRISDSNFQLSLYLSLPPSLLSFSPILKSPQQLKQALVIKIKTSNPYDLDVDDDYW